MFQPKVKVTLLRFPIPILTHFESRLFKKRTSENSPFDIQSSLLKIDFKCADMMGWSTLSLIVLLASSAVESAKPFKESEICPCVPLNVCPGIKNFSKEDAKYFATVLRCAEGLIRCCPNNKITRRSDDVENIILIDDAVGGFVILPETKDLLTAYDVEQATEINELTTEATPEARSLESELTTTEIFNGEETTTDVPESDREPKLIDNNISVIYPDGNNVEEEKKNEIIEHLFLIFPNGEIEAALATSTAKYENPLKKPRRVLVRKRLINKLSETLEGAESKVTQSVVEPAKMDIEEVKKRLTNMVRQKRRKTTQSSTTTTTEIPVEETTVKKQKKKIKFRKQKTTTTSTPVISKTRPTATTFKPRDDTDEVTTKKPRRRIVYDTSSRTNFLRRPSSPQSTFDDDLIEQEVIATTTTTQKPEEFEAPQSVSEIAKENKQTTTFMPKVVQEASRIDIEHQAMLETVHKTLSAIHSGVDMQLVEKMVENHRTKMKKIRSKPQTTSAPTGPTVPFRGSARFRKPVTTQTPSFKHDVTHMRTRNLSRTRNTPATPVTDRSVRNLPRTAVTQPPFSPFMNFNSILEEVDMPPKQKAPLDFKASPLFGITMDKDNEMDSEMIEKIHETLRAASDVQNGFFPVIQNGTPSTIL